MTTKLVPSTEFHFFIEDDTDFGQPVSSWAGGEAIPAAAQPLVLKQGPARLAWDALEPALLPILADDIDSGPCFEAIDGRDAQPRLLLRTDRAHPAYVN